MQQSISERSGIPLGFTLFSMTAIIWQNNDLKY